MTSETVWLRQDADGAWRDERELDGNPAPRVLPAGSWRKPRRDSGFGEVWSFAFVFPHILPVMLIFAGLMKIAEMMVLLRGAIEDWTYRPTGRVHQPVPRPALPAIDAGRSWSFLWLLVPLLAVWFSLAYAFVTMPDAPKGVTRSPVVTSESLRMDHFRPKAAPKTDDPAGLY